MATPRWRRFGFVWIVCLLFAGAATPAHADEIWVAPTSQADLGGLGVASNVFWPATLLGAVRLAWAIPADLQTFQTARLVLIPAASSPAPVLTFYLCPAQSSQVVTANCAGPLTQGFTSTANQLLEIDMTDAIGARLGAPGASYLSVLAFTTPTTTTDHIVGLRFSYAPKPPAGVASLAANTFTGTQTAPAFVGDGSGLTNLPVPNGVASLGANTFAGTQTAPAFVGSGAGLTGVAKLQANTFVGTQTIDTGNLALGPSTATTGNLTKNGSPFLHNFGANNTFLGTLAGNFTMTGAQNTATGRRALFSNAQGFNNTATGYLALVNNSDGSYNTAAGAQALETNTIGSFNTATGESALLSNTTGFNNTASGQQALGSNISGDANTATGQSALYANSTGSHNTANGYHALMNNSTGVQNTAGGNFALFSNTNGFNNTALGFQADVSLGNLINATAIGANAVVSLSNAMVLGDNSVSVGIGTPAPSFKLDVQGGLINASGGLCINNVCQTSWPSFGGSATLGANTFSATQTISSGNLALPISASATSGVITLGGSQFLHNYGTYNTFLGVDAGNFTMTGGQNTATGNRTLYSNTTGSSNTANGQFALYSNTSGSSNTAVGQLALLVNDTGSNNTATGQLALRSNTTGPGNTANGQQSLYANTTGSYNTATGLSALYSNASGSDNTASGVSALRDNTTGFSNTATGREALMANTTGFGNTSAGYQALRLNTNGSGNTAVGLYAGYYSTGNFNTFIGDNSGTFASTHNATAIGANAIVDASNKIRLGGSEVTVIEGQVAYTFTSDRTKKENFQPVNAKDILRKLASLDVTSWNYIGHDANAFRHYGPMAQDFFAAFGNDGTGTVGTPTAINSGDQAGILMLAVQALEAENRRLQQDLQELRATMDDLKVALTTGGVSH